MPLKIRRGNIADIPVLATGELGYAIDQNRLYIGTGAANLTIGVTATTCAYASAAGTAAYAVSAGTAAYALSADYAISAGALSGVSATAGQLNAATSYPASAAYATAAGTAAYAISCATASYATGAATSVNATYAVTAAAATTALSATHALSATYADTAAYAVSAATASYASLAGTATYASTAGSAAYAVSAATATYALTAATASYATLAGTAVYAGTAGTATYATAAGTAAYAVSALTALYAEWAASGAGGTGSYIPDFIIDVTNPPSGLTACTGDGSTNNTSALFSINAYASGLGGAVIAFPDGDYWISADVLSAATNTHWVGYGNANLITSAVTSGTTALYNIVLQVANGASGVVFDNLGFDQSRDSNVIPDSASFAGHHILYAQNFYDLEVSRCRFKGYGVTFVLTQPTQGYGHRIYVHDCYAEFTRKVEDDYDVSVFNLDALYVRSEDNYVKGVYATDNSYWLPETAQEIHCPAGNIVNNISENVKNGILLVNYPMAYDKYDDLCFGSTIVKCNQLFKGMLGVSVWGGYLASSVTRNLLIEDNYINTHMGGRQYRPTAAFEFRDYTVNDGYFRNVRLANNIAEYTWTRYISTSNQISFTTSGIITTGSDFTDFLYTGDYIRVSGCTACAANNKAAWLVSASSNQLTFANGTWVATAESSSITIEISRHDVYGGVSERYCGAINGYTNNSIEDMDIHDNTFINQPFGISLRAVGAANYHKRVKIYDNRFVDCAWANTFENRYEGIFNLDKISSVTIEDNQFIEGGLRPASCIYFFVEGASADAVTVIHNDTSNLSTASFLYSALAQFQTVTTDEASFLASGCTVYTVPYAASAAGGGGGDMTKAVYDTDNDGTVNSAAYATSAAYAVSASTAANATTAAAAASASYAVSASTAANATTAATAQGATTAVNAVSALYAVSAGYAVSASTAAHATSASTATYALTAATASYATAAGTAAYAVSALTATYANTAAYSVSAATAGYAVSAATAGYAVSCATAGYAVSAGYSTSGVFSTSAATARMAASAYHAGSCATASTLASGAIINAGTSYFTGTISIAYSAYVGRNATVSGNISSLGNIYASGTVSARLSAYVGGNLFVSGYVSGTATYALTAGYAVSAGYSTSGVFATSAATAANATTAVTAQGATTALNANKIFMNPTSMVTGTYVGDVGSCYIYTSALTGNVLYMSTGNGFVPARADASGTVPGIVMALASGTGYKLVLNQGYVYATSITVTAQNLLWLSTATNGAVTTTKPTAAGNNIQYMGYAVATSIIYFNPDKTWVEI